MMPSDAVLAALCASIYGITAPVGFEHFDPGNDDGVCWALKRLPGFDVVVFRGSLTFEDWVRDLAAAPVPTRLGHVHGGFYLGLEHVWGEVRPLIDQPVIVTGHSLGAARASIFTAIMVMDGRPPAQRVVFGEPKPGYADLGELVAAAPGRSYRNGDGLHHDLVTDVPYSFPQIPYVHPTPIVPVCAQPPASDRWGVFSYHHIELYQAALEENRNARQSA